MEFTVKLVYNEEDLLALVHAHRWPKGQNRVLRKAALVIGVLLTALVFAAAVRSCTSEILHSLPGAEPAPEIPNLMLGIFFWGAVGLSLVTRNSDWYWKKLTWKSYQEKGSELDYRFSEDGFTVTLPTSRTEMAYSSIAGVFEDAGHYVLLLPAKNGFILRKDAFTQGTPEQFRDFIAQKTGRPVKYVR